MVRSGLSLLMLTLIPALAFARPDLPPPPDSIVVPTGEGMALNGIAIDVRRFESRAGVDEIIQFYRRKWPEDPPDDPGMVVSDALQPWTIATRLEDGYLMTVQVKPRGRGSEGILAISEPPQGGDEPDIGNDIPKMDGSKIVTDLAADDAGKEGRVVLVTNGHSVRSNADFYRERYVGDGWKAVMDREVGPHMHTLAFDDLNTKVNIVTMRSQAGGSVIMINIEKSKWLF